MPFIGHTGICSADGVIHDFAGPYFVSIDDFSFGVTHKYVQLKVSAADFSRYNDSVESAD